MTYSFRLLMPCLAASIFVLAGCASRGGPDKSSDRRPPQQSGNNAGQGFSGVGARPIGLFFASLDTDRDGVTTRADLDRAIEAEWRALQGPASAIAFRSWSLRTLGSADAFPTFMSFDTNFNGIVDRTEFAARLNKSFDRLDTNRDNRVTRAEMVFTVDAPRGQQQKSGERESRGGGRQGGGGRQ